MRSERLIVCCPAFASFHFSLSAMSLETCLPLFKSLIEISPFLNSSSPAMITISAPLRSQYFNCFPRFLDPNDIYDTWSVQVTFSEPDSLLATTFPLADNLCFGDCEAEEQLFIQGGTLPYSFSINGGVTQTITCLIYTSDAADE